MIRPRGGFGVRVHGIYPVREGICPRICDGKRSFSEVGGGDGQMRRRKERTRQMADGGRKSGRTPPFAAVTLLGAPHPPTCPVDGNWGQLQRSDMFIAARPSRSSHQPRRGDTKRPQRLCVAPAGLDTILWVASSINMALLGSSPPSWPDCADATPLGCHRGWLSVTVGGVRPSTSHRSECGEAHS